MKQRIPFVGPSHESRSTNWDAQKTLNCYIELDDNTPRAPSALLGRPGLNLEGTIGNGPLRGMLTAGNNLVVVVSGSEIYTLINNPFFGYQATYRGLLPTSTAPVSMASNGAHVLIVDGVGAVLVDVLTGVAANVTDVDFPFGVSRVAYQDGYFIVAGDGSQQFYINETPNDGTAWNGLDFASAEGSPDATIGVISDHRELWLFGSTSIEVWINTGNADFPFERSGNTFIEHGCTSARTIAKLDNTIFWLGKDDRGGLVVWKANGYTPVRVSNHAIDGWMQSYETVSDAQAFGYQQDGHSFYILTFPTAAKTWAYDVSTNLWFDWSTRDPATLVDGRWRANCHAVLGGVHLVGDYSNGKFYSLNLNYFLDDGNPIKYLRRTQALENMQNRVFYSSLQVDMETGVGGTLEMRYSNDGGHTWSATKTASTGTAGAYDTRCIFKNLGSGRNRVWEISTTSNAKFAVMGAVAYMTPGES